MGEKRKTGKLGCIEEIEKKKKGLTENEGRKEIN